MKVSYLFLPTGFEEIEVATVVDILRRADVEIKTVSMTDGTEVTGAHKLLFVADETYEKMNFDESDFLILPGGEEATSNRFRTMTLN